MTARDIAERCKGARRTRSGWTACCPAHEDSSPSLSLTDGESGVLVHCFAGCAPEAIMDALGLKMTDLFADAPAPSQAKLNGPSAPPLALGRYMHTVYYQYRDDDGTLLYEVERRQYQHGKRFKQRQPDGNGGWAWTMAGARRVLYHLPEVRAAIQAGKPVVIVEGEKDVETLRELGVPATTNVGGAGKWERSYTNTLTGAHVVLLPDHDQAGHDHMQAVAQALAGHAASIKIVELPGLGQKEDASDWLAAGGDLGQFWTLCEAAPEWDAAARASATGQNGTAGSCGSATSWPLPETLPSGLPAVPLLLPELLPDAIRPWLVDIAERQQVPLEFVAVPALIALATVVGRKATIRPKQRDDWVVVPNLWGAIVGRPGLLKTPALKAALAPLDRLIATAAEAYRVELAEGQAALAAHEAQVKALKQAMEGAAKKPSTGGKTLDDLKRELIALQAQAPVPVCERRYRTNDGTVEKLGELFQENPEGFLLFRDELSGWLRGLDKFGREGDREFFLEAWNGDGSFTVDRIGRGTKHIPALCLSICGGIQPGKLTAYIEDAITSGHGDDGLIQRFQLLLWPDSPTTWMNVDRYPDTAAKNTAYAVYQRLAEAAASWFGCQQDSASDLPSLAFAPDAQELFDAWRADLEATLRDGSLTCPALESHLAKYRSLMPSLALLFHLADVATHQTTQPAVSLDAARLAATWCDFLKPHAERAYFTVMAHDLHAAHALAAHLKRGDIHDGDTVRGVYRRQWSGLTTPERVGDALAVLERLHWLRVEEHATNGRATDVIMLNPQLHQT